jgi:hypothetical protein
MIKLIASICAGLTAAYATNYYLAFSPKTSHIATVIAGMPVQWPHAIFLGTFFVMFAMLGKR